MGNHPEISIPSYPKFAGRAAPSLQGFWLYAGGMLNEKYAEEILSNLFRDARMHFGNAIRSHWFYDRDDCPGCGSEVDALEKDGERLVSINAYIHRERGVLIGYFLCSRCLKDIQAMQQRGPLGRSPLHENIEATIVAAYRDYIGSLDA